MNNVFCVILTKYRLYQGVALCRSLKYNMQAADFKMFILCLDNETYEIFSLLNMENVNLVHVNKIEKENPLLLTKKIQRGKNEYCWTLKPVFLQYIFDQFPKIDRVTYLDADLCFFSDPMTIFHDMPQSDVLLTKHDFPDKYSFVANESGKYNSGFISFKRGGVSDECLQWWKEKCFDWCYNKAENGKFGDQKYLDEMSNIFRGVNDVKTPGVNIAPWNHSKYRFSIRDGKFYINNDRLIFYHFCGFRIISQNKIALTVGFDKEYVSIIYDPYIHVLKEVISDIGKIRPNFSGYFIEKGRISIAQFYYLDNNGRRKIL